MSLLASQALAQTAHQEPPGSAGLRTVLTRSELKDALKSTCGSSLRGPVDLEGLMNGFGWELVETIEGDPQDTGYFQNDPAALRMASVYEQEATHEFCMTVPAGETRDPLQDCVRLLEATHHVDRIDLKPSTASVDTSAKRHHFNRWYVGDARGARSLTENLACSQGQEAALLNNAGIDNSGIEEMANFAMDNQMHGELSQVYATEVERVGSRTRALSVADRKALKILISETPATPGEDAFLALDSANKAWNPRMVAAAYGELIQKTALARPGRLDGMGYYSEVPVLSDQEIWQRRQEALVNFARGNGVQETAANEEDRRYVLLTHKPKSLLTAADRDFLVRYVTQLPLGERVTRWNEALGADRVAFADFIRSDAGRSLGYDTEPSLWDYFNRNWTPRN